MNHIQVVLANVATGAILLEASVPSLTPAAPYLADVPLPSDTQEHDLLLTVRTAQGRLLIRYAPKNVPEKPQVPEAATEPPAPEAVGSTDMLYVTGRAVLLVLRACLTQGGVKRLCCDGNVHGAALYTSVGVRPGLHLDQYRHPTREATAYWREALRRDPGDARCNTAMGLWHYKRCVGGAEVVLQRIEMVLQCAEVVLRWC